MKRTLAIILVAITLFVAVVPLSTGASYDERKAAHYAYTYALKYNSRQFQYYSGGDCTNYVSQCIWEGGYAMDTAPANKDGVINETTKWYNYIGTTYSQTLWIKYNYRQSRKTSTTFIRVYNTGNGAGLFQYLTNTKSCSYTYATQLSEIIKYANQGDIIQCANKGKEPEHSIFVQDKINGDLLIDAHSNERQQESFTSTYFNNYDCFYIIHLG